MYLNFHSIYPFLNNYQLLHGSLDQSILTDPKTTTEEKVDIVVGWLPKCKQSDYLTPFITCLRESSEQAGDAHLELADELEMSIQKVLQIKRSGMRRLFSFYKRPREPKVIAQHGMFSIPSSYSGY